ncbi:MAG: C4-dicarboxylate transporter DctA [Rickettsiales bacterium]|nr:C4-dicarboxylate transporter DctA [Rickettsiales bacterium]
MKLRPALLRKKQQKALYKDLFFQVVVAIFLGVALGHYEPDLAVKMKPLGDAFINLIKMMIAPIIFCTVVSGIAGMQNMKSAGRIGVKALIYFEVMTTLALILGLLFMHIYNPATGMNITPDMLDKESVKGYVAAASHNSTTEFFMHMIPSHLVSAFTEGDILQVLVVSLLFACALSALGNRAQGVYALIQQMSEILFKMIEFIVLLAPLGAFGAIAYTIGKFGIDSLGNLASLVGVFYLSCFLFVAIALGIVMRLCGLSLWALVKYLKEEFFIVLGTSSSETVLPRLIEKLSAAGCSRQVVGMVIPTGYSFNLDGTSLYLTMAALFIAEAMGIKLSFGDQLTLLGVLLLTSKGAAGVTGSGFVVLAGSLSAVGHIPLEGVALILGVDRFMSTGRALTNMIGNGVAAIVVAKWEKELDMTAAHHMLSGKA